MSTTSGSSSCSIISDFQELIELKKTKDLINEELLQFIENYKLSGCNSEQLLSPILIIFQINRSDFKKLKVLLNLLLLEPVRFVYLLKKCVLRYINATYRTQLIGYHILFEQLHITLRLVGFSQGNTLPFDPQKNLLTTGLSTLRCILSAFSTHEKYILQSIWYCINGCKGNRITSEVSVAPSCGICGNYMKEYTKLRSMSDFRTLKVFPCDNLFIPHKIGKVINCIFVRITDNLCEFPLILGQAYRFVGIYNFNKKVFIALNITQH